MLIVAKIKHEQLSRRNNRASNWAYFVQFQGQLRQVCTLIL